MSGRPERRPLPGRRPRSESACGTLRGDDRRPTGQNWSIGRAGRGLEVFSGNAPIRQGGVMRGGQSLPHSVIALGGSRRAFRGGILVRGSQLQPGGSVDPVSLVLNGLASGAAQDAADSVSDAVKSAYTKLKQLASATALGGSSARSRAAPGSPNPSDRTRSDTHSSLPVWTPTCRCATFRRPPPMLTRGPRSGMTRPAEAWTGTPHISLRPTSLALPGNYTA